MLTLSRDLIVAPLALIGSGTILHSITLNILSFSQRRNTRSFRSRSVRRSLTKHSGKGVKVWVSSCDWNRGWFTFLSLREKEKFRGRPHRTEVCDMNSLRCFIQSYSGSIGQGSLEILWDIRHGVYRERLVSSGEELCSFFRINVYLLCGLLGGMVIWNQGWLKLSFFGATWIWVKLKGT